MYTDHMAWKISYGIFGYFLLIHWFNPYFRRCPSFWYLDILDTFLPFI